MDKAFKLPKFKIMALAILTAMVLLFFPRIAEKTQAQGALCDITLPDTPYFQQYCTGNMGNFNNFNPYLDNTPSYNNQPSYNYNYPSYQNNSSFGYNSTCDVVERSSPYYRQYCIGGNPNPYPGNTSSYYNIPSYNYPSYQNQYYNNFSSSSAYANAYSSAGQSQAHNTLNHNNSIANISDNFFSPRNLTVPAGTTVMWNNTGSMAHTVTADNGMFDSGTINAGGNYSVTFSTTGTFAYYCRFHGGPGGAGMSGTITITAAGSGQNNNQNFYNSNNSYPYNYGNLENNNYQPYQMPNYSYYNAPSSDYGYGNYNGPGGYGYNMNNGYGGDIYGGYGW